MRRITEPHRAVESLECRRLLSAVPVPVVDLAVDEVIDRAVGGPTSVNADGTVYFSVPTRFGDSAGLWKATPDGRTTFIQTFSNFYNSTAAVIGNMSPGGGGAAFFTVTTGTTSGYVEVWRTDGTAAGTRKIQPYGNPLYVGSNYQVPFVRLGENTYYTVAGTLMKASDANPYAPVAVAGGGGIASLTVSNGALYFLDSTSTVPGLYRVNDAGTFASRVAAATSPRSLADVNGTLYFTAYDSAAAAYKLYKSDGTGAGTQAVAPVDVSSFSPPTLVGVGDTVYFAASSAAGGTELWKSDGTAAGTSQVIDLSPGTRDSSPANLTAYDGRLYFSASNSSTAGRYLWRTDGTPGGTELVTGLDGDRTSAVVETAVSNGTLYFGARTVAGGYELWRTDTTGTRMVSDRYPGRGSSRPHELIDANGILYYQGVDPVLGYGLFKTDGTAAGTALVKDYLAGPLNPNFSGPRSSPVSDGRIFYVDGDGTNTGRELYVTGGTPGGGHLVADIFPGTQGSSPGNFMAVGGTVFFSAQGSFNQGVELWKSDGTAAGTVMVKDINPKTGGATSQVSSSPQSLVNVNGTLYFSADDGVHGRELWKSDGTAAGTVGFDLAYQDQGSYPQSFSVIGDTLYFTATTGSGNSLLKIAPGDTAPVWLKSFRPGVSDYFRDPVALNGYVYFAGNDNNSGYELWRTNGTSAGTTLVKDIRPGSGDSSPGGLTLLGNQIIFFADDGVIGREIWRTDGTAAGTYLLKDIMTPNSSSNSGNNGSFPSIGPSVSGLTYFTANDRAHGPELWRTDGTPGGTVLVKDIIPGEVGSGATSLTLVAGRVYFTADDGVSGSELWTTDGTEAGTVRVTDLNPGAGPSTPALIREFNGAVFFVASDGVNPLSFYRFEPETVKPTAGTPWLSAYGNRQAIKVAFDEDVSGSLSPGDLVLSNLTTGVTIDPGAIALGYDDGHNVANFTFPGLPGGLLPDGNYHLSIAASGVRDTSNNPLAGDVALDFFVLAADANHDRLVNFDDLLVLAKNYNKVGATFDEGDFNYDGVVNFDDLLILAKAYNKVLAAPPPPAPAPLVKRTAGTASLFAAVAPTPVRPSKAPTPPKVAVRPTFGTRKV